MAIPIIGHEVIVTNLEADPDQPLITGRTYHASNTPPYPLPANKTRTVIRTQSHKSKGFNELRFEDATDQEQIWFHAQKDLELLTLNDRTEEIKRDSHLKIHRHRQTEIGNDEHHTVHRHRFEHTEGAQHLSVEGTIHMRAGQAWLSESGRELHVKSGEKAVLEADGEITLKVGGSFIKLDASGITIVGPQVKINAGGSPGSGSGQAAEQPRLPGEAAPEISEDVTLMAHQQAELESEEAGFFQNAWRHTKGFGRGAAGVVEEAVEGTIDMAVYSAKVSPGSWALAPLHPSYQGHSGAINATRETTAMLLDNPGLVVDAYIEPYQEAMARGETGEAIGRGFTEAASMIFAPAKIGQAGRTASRLGPLGIKGDALSNSSAANAALHARYVDELATLNRQGLLNELGHGGIKHTPENTVDIRKASDGKIVFLETGNRAAGLEHIMTRHEQDFANVGINSDQIPDTVMEQC